MQKPIRELSQGRISQIRNEIYRIRRLLHSGQLTEGETTRFRQRVEELEQRLGSDLRTKGEREADTLIFLEQLGREAEREEAGLLAEIDRRFGGQQASTSTQASTPTDPDDQPPSGS